MAIRVLCIGDVCGSIGRDALQKSLNLIKKQYKIDFTIANGENSADGNGVTPESAGHLFGIGIDVITGGNHTFRRKEVFDFLDENAYILRPHNLHTADYGRGYTLVDMGRTKVAVINLCGTVYLEQQAADNPFLCVDELLEKAEADGAKIIIVDFHAEATSEKRALGLYVDGKASAFFGTHTHVQTADLQILPGGTGYITDLGMTGPKNSVLGVKSDIIISRFKDKTTDKFQLAAGECIINACVFDIDEYSGKTVAVERIFL